MGKQIKNKRLKHNVLLGLKDIALMTIGSAVFALAIAMFTAPNNVVPGGVTGVTTMLNYLFDLPIGVMSIVINIPIFIWGLVENGKRFLAKTAFATVLSSVLIDVFAQFVPPYKGDIILAALFGGLVLGLGMGLIFYAGGTTGGVDIIARNLKNHMPFLTMGTLIIAVDGLIVAATIAVYKSIESGLYAVIVIFVSSKVIDSVVYGFSRDNGQAVYIITEKHEEIVEAIFKNIVRGVTKLEAKGAYSQREKLMLFCAVRPRQVYKLTNLVKSIDPNAFVVVTKAELINGSGFSVDEDKP